jgi:hypothetical protein
MRLEQLAKMFLMGHASTLSKSMETAYATRLNQLARDMGNVEVANFKAINFTNWLAQFPQWKTSTRKLTYKIVMSMLNWGYFRIVSMTAND